MISGGVSNPHFARLHLPQPDCPLLTAVCFARLPAVTSSHGPTELLRNRFPSAHIVFASLALSAAPPCLAADPEPAAGHAVQPGAVGAPVAAGEPTSAECTAEVERARILAETLPAGDLSRRFAERYVLQALTEAGNREFDDCLEWAARARQEVEGHFHKLQPGEELKILRPDQ